MLKQFISLVSFGIVLVMIPTKGNAQITVIPKQHQLKNYAVAIPNFKNAGTSNKTLGKKIADVLRSDLRLSGIFRVIDKQAYLEKPPKNGIEPNTFDFQPWRQISAQALIKGSYQNEGAKLRLKFRFYEVGTGKLSVKEDYLIKQKKMRNLRWYIHLFSEKIYRSLTNQKGIFTTKIACTRRFAGKQEIWMMDFDGFGARRITNNGSINLLPSWSPDGKYIAYTSYKNRNPDLYIYDLTTGKRRKISKYRGLNTGAAWSPNGSQIAYSASRGKARMEIYIANVQTGATRKLNTKSKWANNLSPSWSPDGKQLAFVSTRHGSPQIFVTSVAGSQPRRLTTIGKYNQSPKWSPLGNWIMFTGRDERNVFDIFLISPKNRQIKRLTQNQGNNVEGAWSRNGRNIVFSSNRSGAAKLYLATSDGKTQQQITFKAGHFETPTWSPPFVK